MSDASAPIPDPTTQPAPDPTVPDPTDGAANQPDTPDPAATGDATVTIRLNLPAGSVFYHGIEGVAPITAEGTAVPAAQLDAVHQAARTNQVTITVVAEGDTP